MHVNILEPEAELRELTRRKRKKLNEALARGRFLRWPSIANGVASMPVSHTQYQIDERGTYRRLTPKQT